MPDEPNPLAHQLAADAYRHLVRTLSLALLCPGDSPEDRRRSDRAAIATIAAFAPANPAEAEVGAQFVVASEQWMHCLRLAQAPGATPEQAMKWRDEAIHMMRQASSALRLLLRLQEARRQSAASGERRQHKSGAAKPTGFAPAPTPPTKPKLH